LLGKVSFSVEKVLRLLKKMKKVFLLGKVSIGVEEVSF